MPHGAILPHLPLYKIAIILIINVSNLDTVKSAQSKQSTKHKHNIYNKLTTKQKKNYTQPKLENYHKTHNVQLQSTV